MKVHEIMTAHARSVAPDTTLVEAAGLMRELDVGALPVLDGDRPAGIVTDRDLVVRGVADGCDVSKARVSEVMSGGVESVHAEDEVEDAVRLMEQRQIRRLLVLNSEDRLVGMLSLGDIATSSNPAFGGMALRDVSAPNEPTARRRRLARESEPAMPAVPGARRGPAGRGRTNGARSARTRAAERSSESSTKQTRRGTGSTSSAKKKSSTRTSGGRGKKTDGRSRR